MVVLTFIDLFYPIEDTPNFHLGHLSTEDFTNRIDFLYSIKAVVVAPIVQNIQFGQLLLELLVVSEEERERGRGIWYDVGLALLPLVKYHFCRYREFYN